MKRILICIAALLASAALVAAQTPEEIIARMETEMDKADQVGIAFTMDMKIPIIGTTSARIYIRGDKSRMEVGMAGVKSTVWMDDSANTTWTWDRDDKKNEVVIEAKKSTGSSGEDNLELAHGVADGYDIQLAKETADAWYFDCKKSRTNTDKDDPKKMTLAVYKDTYMLKELSAKVSGITVALKDSVLGVSEDEVTYSPSKTPGATVVDKR